MPPPSTPHARPDTRLLDAARGQLSFMRDRLRRYALLESPTGDAEALAACAEAIIAGHREIGGTTVRDGQHLITTWPGTARTGPAVEPYLVILGHYDTVWPVGQLASMPYVDDGTTIVGPGTYDMKGGLVALEAALRVLAELDVPLAREVRAVIVADEEIGSPDGRRVVEEQARGAVAVLGLEPPHPRGVLKTGRRGSTRIRIEVTGREAHAALDRSKGVSAIDELLDQLLAVRRLLPDDGSTLCNIGTVAGGSRANVIAGRAEAELGLRFTNLEAERAVLDQLRALTPIRDGARVETVILSNRPAWAEPEQNPLLEAVSAIGQRIGLDIEGRPAAGAGDTNFTGALGVPSLDGFGPNGRGAHALEEQIHVESLPERAALLAAILADGLDESVLRQKGTAVTEGET